MAAGICPIASSVLFVASLSASCDMCGALNGGDGLPCESHRACRADQVCSAGRCVDLCRDDTDCPIGQRCIDMACAMPGSDGGGDAARDAASDSGRADGSDAASSDATATDRLIQDRAAVDRTTPSDAAAEAGTHDVVAFEGGQRDTTGASDLRLPDAATDRGSGVDGARADAAVPCSCPLPDDVCQGGYCYLSSFVCNVLNLCAPGYSCTEDNRCRCSDRARCGAVCSDDSPCAPGERCYAAGLCMATIAECFDPAFCQADEWCNREMCELRSVSSRPSGSTCELREDCASGLCVTHVCLNRCNSRSDCTDGLVCQLYQSWDFDDAVGGCILPGASGCGSNCGGSQICDSSYCRPRLCRRNADCPGTESCRLGGGMPSPTSCEATSNRTCADSELVLDYMGACSNGATCHLSQNDCAPPYQCDDRLSSYTYRDTGVCIRL